jgi:molybdate transport system ATP-binding protein
MTMTINATVSRGTFQMRIDARIDERVTGLYGPSGAGKTTLLHVIVGLIRPQNGRISIDDQVLDDAEEGLHLPIHRRRIGLVFQHGHLFQHLSVADNLHYGERLLAPEARRVPFAHLVDMLDIGPLLARRPAELSGGERQRVALGRSLMASPRLLLLDEPLASLDRSLNRQILRFLRRIRDDLHIPFIYVSHDFAELMHLTRHLLLLHAGTVQAHGDVTDIISRSDRVDDLRTWGFMNAVPAVVASHDGERGVTTVVIGNEVTIRAQLRDEPPGTACTLVIRPTDVALAMERSSAISVDNQVPGRVERVTQAKHHVVVLVDIGTPLLVEISSSSADAMHLAVGMSLWCQFPAHSVSSD